MRHDLRALSKRHQADQRLVEIIAAMKRIGDAAWMVNFEREKFREGHPADLESLIDSADLLRVEAERLRLNAVIFKQLSREGESSTAAHAEASGETKDAEPSRDDLAGGEVPREAGAPPAKTSTLEYLSALGRVRVGGGA